MKMLMYTTETKLKELKEKVQNALIKMYMRRECGNEQLIVALVMIAIAVALIIIFKEKITTLMTSFMASVTTKINTALGAS